MNDQNDDLPPELKVMMRQSAIASEHQTDIKAIGARHSDIMEHEVLFPLWQLLGDGTPNYWQAMLTITVVTQITNDAAKKINDLPANLRADVYQALSKLLANQAACQREMHQRGEETERQMKAVK